VNPLPDDLDVVVLLPIVALAAIAVGFLFLMQRRRGTFDPLEIGSLYIAAVVLYTFFPLFGFLWNGSSHTPLNDQRLFLDQPTSVEMARIGWFHVTHLLSFAPAYVVASGNRPLVQTQLHDTDRNLLPCALVLYLFIAAFLLLVNFAYDLTAETYVESYMLPYRLPLFLGQCYRVLQAARYTLETVVIVLLGSRWRTTYPFIACLIAASVAMTFIEAGSRAPVVLLSVAVAITYQHLVRPFRLWHLAVGALSLLFVFELAGLLRNDPDRTDPLAFFGRSNEFESIFANAYHVDRLKQAGQLGELPPGWYASDFLRLIPPQVRPVDGTNPTMWYMETFYPEFAAQGGRLCFGTVAESIIGWGWPDLVCRGLAVGLLFGMVHRYLVNHQGRFWPFAFYVWLAANCFWTFRSSTFFLVAYTFYHFLPTYVALRLCCGLAGALRPSALPATPEAAADLTCASGPRRP
jgi:hypothetical protein